MRTKTQGITGSSLPSPLRIRVHLQDLLATLRRVAALAPLQLAISCEQETHLPHNSQNHSFCGSLGNNGLCDADCRASFEDAFRDACQNNRPLIFSCATGLLFFAIPFRDDRDRNCCLFAGGVRDEAPDLAVLEKLSNAPSGDGGTLLEKLLGRPQIKRAQFEEILGKTLTLLTILADEQTLARPLRGLTQRLAGIAGASAEIDRVPSSDAVLELLGETLILLFDLPRVIILAGEGEAFSVRVELGPAAQTKNCACPRLRELLGTHPDGKPLLLRQEIGEFFPDIDSDRAICVPLRSEGLDLGLAVIFDSEMPERDLLLLELLAGRAAAKLNRLRLAALHQQRQATSQRLIVMLGQLSLVETREELYQRIVAMSCELLQAARSSLMLLDETGEWLRIVAARGINLEVAAGIPLRFGEGIAGRVAQSGLHLLVTDIEKDSRVGIANRPRFQTKSFICIPIKAHERTVGVLNLADKETGTTFTDEDLATLRLLIDHAALLIERVAVYENARKLEELAARDPLTGLYNRRMLEARFQEELSRCFRLKQHFTIMMIDLDHFKIYNDQCGHVAGDHALKKVAQLLKKSAREMDIVTRYGGEEFCLLLPNTSKEEALFVAERIRRAIEAEIFPGETALPTGRLTASIGVACYPDAGEKFETLINAADVALYQAKSKGRNRLASFEVIPSRIKKTG
ncbi:MAG: diguanylate cyclase [Trichloromonas sp.]|nr:diguanylate cyclase [Trichloromonas sp.]